MHTQVGAMFEDCLSDLMEELWSALQYGGSAHSKVDMLANRMAQREAEIEELAQKRCECMFVCEIMCLSVCVCVCACQACDFQGGGVAVTNKRSVIRL